MQIVFVHPGRRKKKIWPTGLDLVLILVVVVVGASTQDAHGDPTKDFRALWERPNDTRRNPHHQNRGRHQHAAMDRTTAKTSWYEVNGGRLVRGGRQGVSGLHHNQRQGRPYHQPLNQAPPPPLPKTPVMPALPPPPPRRNPSSSPRPLNPSSRPSGGTINTSGYSSRTRNSVPSSSSSSFQSRPDSSQSWHPYNQGHPAHNPWSNIRTAHRPTHPGRRDKRPNIVLIIADDQDVELGSLNYMPRLMNIMRDAGAYFPQAYTSTPMCCPSRSSLLTGMYIHNHEVYTNNDNCSSTLWQQTHERRTFATYLNDAGYRTGYFGKYLNKYKGSHVPVGWRDWAGLLMNSKYYNYTVNRNNQWKKYGDQYPRDYFPHVITNDGIHFLETSKRLDPSPPPVMMVLSYPAPHGPEDSAPEHAHRFFNATDHHTMAYDYAPNPDKQWILQSTNRMHDIQLKFTDVLMTKRLQTLQTVDESVQRIVNTLDALGELGNTYIFYTSDHGYHLGQFGLVKGKSMPFEFDIKVPFLVRGPGIKPGSQINNIALNVDLAPTFLDIAGIKAPPHMDGRSLLPLLQASSNGDEKVKDWRDTFLVESSGRLREEDALELRKERREHRSQGLAPSTFPEGGLFTSKHERLELVCERDEYQSPCSPLQKWECVYDGLQWRLKKCRFRNRWRRRNCVCEEDHGMGFLVKLDSVERRKQRLFLKKHVTQDFKTYDAKFLKAFSDVDSSEVAEESLGRVQRHSRWYNRRKNRHRRNASEKLSGSGDDSEFTVFEEDEGGEEDLAIVDDVTEGAINDDDGDEVDVFVSEEEMRAIDEKIITLADELEGLETVSSTSATLAPGNQSSSAPSAHDYDSTHLEHGCRATETSVDCTDEVYQDPHAWKVSKTAIDDQIRRLRHQLFVLKDVRKHLRNSRPDSDYEENYESVSSEDFSDLDVSHILPYGEDGNIVLTEGSGYVDKMYGSEESVHFNIPVNISKFHLNNTIADKVTAGEAVTSTENPLKVESEDINYDLVITAGEEESISGVKEDPLTVDIGEEIIIGRDYDEDGIRTYRNRNYIHGRRRSKGRREKFDIFRGMPQSKHRNKHRNRKNRRGEENETTLEVHGSNASSGHSGAASQFELYPDRNFLPAPGQPLSADNETSKQPICWCDQRMATKLAIQQERAKKRSERQKLKLERLKKKEQKMKRRLKKNKDYLAVCNPMYAKLNCYQHDNDHWRTPPLWHDGKFCFCMNAPNNTYWCLRTINETHNFLYCEFITGLVTYYDLNIDPYQLRNVAFTLSNSRVADLHHKLEKLRVCVGADQCDDIQNKQSKDRVPPQSALTNPSLMDNALIPTRRLTKTERMQEREERRRLRKLSKKIKRNELYESKHRHVVEAMGSGEHKVRLPRKSRIEKERKRERQRARRDRRRKNKERKNSSLRE